MDEIISSFRIDGRPLSCSPYGEGHINSTFLVETDSGKRYLLQRISGVAFKNIPGLMMNFSLVTEYIAKLSDTPERCMRAVPTLDGGTFVQDAEGEYWRVVTFVEDTVCLQTASNAEEFGKSGRAFGEFQRLMRDFPAETLCETIPDFHNTPDRFRQFREAVAADACGRAELVRSEIDFALAREQRAGTLESMRERGELPLRVTHNDTKLNNVLFDRDTLEPVCVVDLDTVMPGLAVCDFGDSIRFGASTAAEDETDLSKVEINLEYFEAYAREFIKACGGLTEAEINTLALSAWTITLEIGIRFLADYLNGDVYFHISRPSHNLDRARTQFKLVADMEKKWDAMEAIIASIQKEQ